MSRILVIDDEEMLRELLRDILEEEGHDVVQAANGRLGVERFKQRDIDLIITDLMMPEKDGFETICELHRMDAEVKIIALTGYGLHNLPVAYDLGASRVFEKPIASSLIKEAVSDLLQE